MLYRGLAEPALGFLRRRRVGPKGRTKYTAAATGFEAYCTPRRLPLSSCEEIDVALDSYLVFLFAGDRTRVQAAREAFYGVRYFYDLHNHHLPLSRGGLEGFKKEDPDVTREPCPWEVLCMACLAVLLLGTEEAALAACALLLCFDSYARPGALCKLRGDSLMKAGPNTWCLVFFPGDRSERSKTFTQDDTVEVGGIDRLWLRHVAAAVHSRRREASSLFGLTLPKLQKYFSYGLAEHGLSHLRYTPHCLRHGGASTDCAAGLPASEVQLRGQWRDARSVARYMKKGVLLRQRARLSRAKKRVAEQALATLKGRLASDVLRLVPLPQPSHKRASSFHSSSSFPVDLSKRRRHQGPTPWKPRAVPTQVKPPLWSA